MNFNNRLGELIEDRNVTIVVIVDEERSENLMKQTTANLVVAVGKQPPKVADEIAKIIRKYMNLKP